MAMSKTYIVEWWNIGRLEHGFNRIKSFFDTANKTDKKIRINSFLKPIIPLFQHSIIPLDVSK